MMLRIILLSLVYSVFAVAVCAQGIRGRISDAQGAPVPFANVYIPQLSTGTTSNIDGDYELKLPPGKWKVLFQYLGYQTRSLELTMGETVQVINMQLFTQEYRIPEIKVLASGEDPAYYIMRRAIALAPYYQKQVSKYSCKVYLKGSGVFDRIPMLFKKQMKKNGVKEDEAFVLETVSRIDFELPDRLTQQVLAMRSSGKGNNTSPMSMITNNLYDAEKYGMVSPVGKSALKAYRFRLDGVFEDQGRTINKIKVIPKANGNDVFSGYIYIAEGFWNIHSADLKLHIPMTDVGVRQVYAEVNKNTWMPVSLDFDMDFSGVGFKMKFNYVASISEYQTTLNPALDHSFLERLKKEQLQEQQMIEEFLAEQKVPSATKAQQQISVLMEKTELSNRETLKLNRLIEKESRRNSPPEPLEIKSDFQVSQKKVNNDSVYWASIRPIPLTGSERKSFAAKDSFLQVSARPEYQDSVRDSKRKFKLKHLFTGKTYDYSVDSAKRAERFTVPGIKNPSLLSFNSVDGLRLELPFRYYRADSLGRLLQFSPKVAYAFAREKVDASFSIARRINGLTNSWVSLGLGSVTEDFNRSSGLSVMNNDFYTIWLEENYKRFFRRDFVQFTASRDLGNGLNMSMTLDYADNRSLTNHSGFSLIDYADREILPNVPVNDQLEDWQLGNHQSFGSRVILEYTPKLRYRIRNHVKTYARSKYPTYSVAYKGALANVFGSDSRYDLLKLGIRQKISMGVADQLSYSVNGGAFLNKERVYFEDFQHFNTQSLGFMFSSRENSFRLLPFYRNSTNTRFLESHVSWQTRSLILKRLPVVRNSSISENLFVNYLDTPELRSYVETGYGISNLFLLLNVEAVAGFEHGRFRSAGIKVSLNL